MSNTPQNLKLQEQSGFFNTLPLDIRRHIYFQYWLEYGIVQHIYSFGRTSHLSHYPCVLDANAFNCRCRPAGPRPEPVVNDDEDANDPGDVNGAIQEILDNPPLTHIPPNGNDDAFATGTLASAPRHHSSHCFCFNAYTAGYDRTAHMRNLNLQETAVPHVTLGLAKPLLVCKRMYVEAGESLYSNVRFSFESADMLERFVACTPKNMSSMIKLVDIMESTPVGRVTAPNGTFGSWARNTESQPSLLPGLCQTLQQLLPNVRELCLTLHIDEDGSSQAPHPLPDNDWFRPLWSLANSMENRRKNLNVTLVTKCNARQEHLPHGTPEQFTNAPFKVVLVHLT